MLTFAPNASESVDIVPDLAFEPILLYAYGSDTYLRSGRWQIVRRGVEVRTSRLPFLRPVGLRRESGDIVIDDKIVREATTNEIMELPSYGIYGCDLIEDLLNARLGTT